MPHPCRRICGKGGIPRKPAESLPLPLFFPSPQALIPRKPPKKSDLATQCNQSARQYNPSPADYNPSANLYKKSAKLYYPCRTKILVTRATDLMSCPQRLNRKRRCPALFGYRTKRNRSRQSGPLALILDSRNEASSKFVPSRLFRATCACVELPRKGAQSKVDCNAETHLPPLAPPTGHSKSARKGALMCSISTPKVRHIAPKRGRISMILLAIEQ